MSFKVGDRIRMNRSANDWYPITTEGKTGTILAPSHGGSGARIDFDHGIGVWHVKRDAFDVIQEDTMIKSTMLVKVIKTGEYMIAEEGPDCDNEYWLIPADGPRFPEVGMWYHAREIAIAFDHEPVYDAMRKGHKIMAIKLVREQTRIGQRAAREFVEQLAIPQAASAAAATPAPVADQATESATLRKEIDSLRTQLEYERAFSRDMILARDESAREVKILHTVRDTANARIDYILSLMTAKQLIRVIKGE
jgi:hypothetical protein